MKIKTGSLKRLLWILVILFILMNGVAALHAYKFTHFDPDGAGKISDVKRLSPRDKIRILVTGVDNPRPFAVAVPTRPFRTLQIRSNKRLECWYMAADTTSLSKRTVILFHGYGGEKSSMLDKSDVFLRLGYSVLLVDFMGSGGSEGNQTTIGFKEAEEVKSCLDYLENAGERHIYLFGTSMGAVAILKALHDYPLRPAGIIIECPFGSLYETVCARFRTMGVPIFPMAGLLVFWGGLENGFSPFSFNPVRYADSVICPCLLLYGEKDEKVSRREIDSIYAHLHGARELRTYPLAGHENYLLKYKEEWAKDIGGFLQGVKR